MTRVFSVAAYLIGAALIVLMFRAVAVDSVLTTVVMFFIALAYGVGGLELLRYQRDTRGLLAAMATLDTSADSSGAAGFESWLNTLPASLYRAVRLRIVGDVQGLPAPVLTPYLVGLLVMLGLLGTFVGMVATLEGASKALEGGTELTVIRQGLAAPIEGLGMAFGTSVAGVAASAMLGLIATLSRRERLAAGRELDRHRDSVFRDHSLSFQRMQAYSALQLQASALPEVMENLTSLTQQLSEVGTNLAAWSERSGEQLLAQQRDFESSVRSDFQVFTANLASALEDSLANTGQKTAETIQPFVGELVSQAIDQFAAEAESRRLEIGEQYSALNTAQSEALEARRQAEAEWQASLGEGLETMSRRLNESTAAIETVSQQSLQVGKDLLGAFEESAERVRSRDQSMNEERAELLQHQASLLKKLSSQTEEQRIALEDMAQGLAASIEQQSRNTSEGLTQLIANSTEQLAGVSSELGQLMTSTLEHTEERLDNLVAHNSDTLDRLSEKLGGQLGASGQQLASSAEALVALSSGFGESVAAFRAANETLAATLTTIVEALATAGERSDEQMGYYVDQAREIIDHNLVTQQTILDRLESAAAEIPARAETA